MLYPAESQVIDGITNQSLTLGNHNMYILFFLVLAIGNKENWDFFLPFPKYRVRDTTNGKLDL